MSELKKLVVVWTTSDWCSPVRVFVEPLLHKSVNEAAAEFEVLREEAVAADQPFIEYLNHELVFEQIQFWPKFYYLDDWFEKFKNPYQG